MRNRIAALTLVAFCAAIPAPIEAADVAVGTRVRLSVREDESGKPRTLRGTVTGSGPGLLTVKPDGEAAAVAVRSDQVVRLEQLLKRSRKTKGAIIGAGILGGTMLGLFVWVCSDLGCEGEDTERAVALVGGAAGFGALLGAAFAPGDRWREIPISRSGAISDPRVRVTVAPAGRGAAVALSLRF